MPELKFRAWDSVTETYIYSDDIPGGMWRYFKTLEERGIRHFESEQCMGGRGRQEQEIYEGDIIKDSFDHWKSGKVVEMSFDFIHEFIEYDLDNSEIEIIGNIHEHPELLTYLK